MGKKLRTELDELGCDHINEDDFTDVIQDLHATLHPAWTEEQLLYHPKQALNYCDAVRHRFSAEKLPDEMILRRLNNIRKASHFKGAE